MSGKSSTGFAGGLIVEGAVIGLIVTLLPRIPLGGSGGTVPRDEVADQRPSLAPQRVALERSALEPLPAIDLPAAELIWRTAVSRPETPVELPPADPAYVEHRLDEAGQQLLSGVTSYLSRHAQEVLEAPTAAAPQQRPPAPLPRSYTAPSFNPPSNAFRY